MLTPSSPRRSPWACRPPPASGSGTRSAPENPSRRSCRAKSPWSAHVRSSNRMFLGPSQMYRGGGGWTGPVDIWTLKVLLLPLYSHHRRHHRGLFRHPEGLHWTHLHLRPVSSARLFPSRRPSDGQTSPHPRPAASPRNLCVFKGHFGEGVGRLGGVFLHAPRRRCSGMDGGQSQQLSVALKRSYRRVCVCDASRA